MSLVLALKNRDTVVVASDVDQPSDGTLKYGQFLNLPGRSILLIAGNTEAVREPIITKVLPKLTAGTSAATLAQLVYAALVIDIVPRLANIAGRIEIIVAGIDPVRHIEEPGLYYLDSARDFHLTIVPGGYVAAGATAAIAGVLEGQDLTTASADGLMVLAKECLTATKLRWPDSVAAHQRLGVISPTQIRILDF